MADGSYEKGKVKVVWVEDNPDKIYSKMFDNEEEADKFGSGKNDYVIFSLEKQSHMEEFEWKILPYGRYKLYQRLIKTLRSSDSTIVEQMKDALS